MVPSTDKIALPFARSRAICRELYRFPSSDAPPRPWLLATRRHVANSLLHCLANVTVLNHTATRHIWKRVEMKNLGKGAIDDGFVMSADEASRRSEDLVTPSNSSDGLQVMGSGEV